MRSARRLPVSEPECEERFCEDEPQVTLWFHQSNEKHSYCHGHAKEAIEECNDAHLEALL